MTNPTPDAALLWARIHFDDDRPGVFGAALAGFRAGQSHADAGLLAALEAAERAINEYYRYMTGGETRGSYDGKPERQGLWDAQRKARAAIAAVKGAA